MSIHNRIQYLNTQIVDLRQLLEKVTDHPLMSAGLKERIEMFEEELNSIPSENFQPTLQFLFSGDAVSGSQGIKSTFVSKIIPPIQGLVKTQLAFNKYGKVGRRGRAKRSSNAELFLTALPKGSFGIELSRLEFDEEDLYDVVDTSEAMKDIINLIKNTTESDELFELTIEATPKRNLNNLKRFLQEVSNERSILKMDSGDTHVELSKEKIDKAAQRVSFTLKEDDEIFINGIFRGVLLDSNRFDIQDEKGLLISGSISEDIDEEQLIEYDKQFLNINCKIHLRVYTTKFKTLKERIDYELLEIISI
jgi:hypothetical protein